MYGFWTFYDCEMCNVCTHQHEVLMSKCLHDEAGDSADEASENVSQTGNWTYMLVLSVIEKLGYLSALWCEVAETEIVIPQYLHSTCKIALFLYTGQHLIICKKLVYFCHQVPLSVTVYWKINVPEF